MNQHHLWKRLADYRHLELTNRAEHVRLVRLALEASRTQRANGQLGLRERLGNVFIQLGFRLYPAASISQLTKGLTEGPIGLGTPSVSTEECA